MKRLNNVEALFVALAVAATSATFATYATAEVPQRAAPARATVVTTAAPMQVVVIKGQRLSAAQKAAI